MANKEIKTEQAPAAIGPYSQGISAENIAFVSGQLPIDPATGEFAGNDIASQTRQSLKNVQAILAENGMTMADVTKTTVLLADIAAHRPPHRSHPCGNESGLCRIFCRTISSTCSI